MSQKTHKSSSGNLIKTEMNANNQNQQNINRWITKKKGSPPVFDPNTNEWYAAMPDIPKDIEEAFYEPHWPENNSEDVLTCKTCGNPGYTQCDCAMYFSSDEHSKA